jgi:hypothetical protein
MKTITEILENQTTNKRGERSTQFRNEFTLWLTYEILESLEGYEGEEEKGLRDIYRDATEHENPLGLTYIRDARDLFSRFNTDVIILFEIFHDYYDYEYNLAFANMKQKDMRSRFSANATTAIMNCAWFIAFRDIASHIATNRGGLHPLDEEGEQ